MPKDRIRLLPDSFKTGVICVDSYEDRRLQGRLWYRHFLQERPFGNLMQFFLLTGEALQSLEFPDAYMKLRGFATFGQPAPGLQAAGPPADGVESGQLATFRIKIVFQQNASWQGLLTWVEGKKEEPFRSALELVMLMDSALQSCTDHI